MHTAPGSRGCNVGSSGGCLSCAEKYKSARWALCRSSVVFSTLFNSQTVAMKPKAYQFLTGVFASFGSLLFGYDLGVIAQVIASKSYQDLFNTTSTDSAT